MFKKNGKHNHARAVAGAALISLALLVTAWTAVHRIPGAGAWVADTLRGALGDRAVADIEDTVYGAVDRVNHWRYAGRRPEARWHAAKESAPQRTMPTPEESAAGAADVVVAFRPADVGPRYQEMQAAGDGQWVAVTPSNQRGSAPLAYKTLVHPDRTRSWAELAVVALDLAQVQLHAVAGSSEPENEAAGAESYSRSARVATNDREALLLAFNGGFKTRHGHHGMRVGGTTLVPPRHHLCTVAGYEDSTVRVASWQKPPDGEPLWWRQTARCLVEDGELHPGLVHELTTSWGAAVGGETVIRRSALGLSQDGATLFVGVANSVTATALADGMRHAGAYQVAQLDVNHAFPRILIYEMDENGRLHARPIIEGLVYTEGQYIRKTSTRDFFYVTEKRERMVRRPTDVVGQAG